MYDIPFIIWHLRKRNPKFISKKEVARFIPSISFALRNGGHIIIDRKKVKRAIDQISTESREIAKKNGCVCIFPEGSRSKTGDLQNFKLRGFKALYESMQLEPNKDSIDIVPITISGTGRITNTKFFPAPIFTELNLYFHDPIPTTEISEASSPQRAKALLNHSRDLIENTLNSLKSE